MRMHITTFSFQGVIVILLYLVEECGKYMFAGSQELHGIIMHYLLECSKELLNTDRMALHLHYYMKMRIKIKLVFNAETVTQLCMTKNLKRMDF